MQPNNSNPTDVDKPKTLALHRVGNTLQGFKRRQRCICGEKGSKRSKNHSTPTTLCMNPLLTARPKPMKHPPRLKNEQLEVPSTNAKLIANELHGEHGGPEQTVEKHKQDFDERISTQMEHNLMTLQKTETITEYDGKPKAHDDSIDARTVRLDRREKHVAETFANLPLATQGLARTTWISQRLCPNGRRHGNTFEASKRLS